MHWVYSFTCKESDEKMLAFCKCKNEYKFVVSFDSFKISNLDSIKRHVNEKPWNDQIVYLKEFHILSYTHRANANDIH